MVRTPPFRILYAPVVYEHLRAIPRKHHGLIKEAIEIHLAGEPNRESTNRKLLSPTTELEAEWELRSGPKNTFRVFYNIDSTRRIVHIVAIGVKRGHRLKIGRDEVKL